MTRTFYLAAGAAMLASCSPQGEALTILAVRACQRPDVQDVVGKEARNMMLKANEDRLWRAAFFGIDLAQMVEQTRVSFGEVGINADGVQAPYSQIVCTGSMQIDGSSAQAGQDIVTVPHLRWSINFAEPTNDPQTATFTIAIDPGSLFAGMLVNGHPPQGGNAAAADSAPVQGEGSANAQTGNNTSDADAAAAAALEDARAVAAEAEAAAKVAATIGNDPAPSARQPSDEELYAPHSN